MNTLRVSFVFLALAGLLLAGAEEARAQDNSWSFQGRGGIAFPVGHQIYEAGPSFGGGFTYWADEAFGLRGGVDLDLLSGKSAADVSGPVDVPDMDVWHFRAGVVFRAMPDADRWSLDFDLLGGVSSVSVSDLPASFDEPAFDDTELSETYTSATAGVSIGYMFTDRITGFVTGDVNYVPTDNEDFIGFSQFDPSNPDAETFTDIWTVPVRAGVKIDF